MLSQFLSNLAAGSITGYITNLLTIKMLFKKYSVVGGGVLQSYYQQFIVLYGPCLYAVIPVV